MKPEFIIIEERVLLQPPSRKTKNFLTPYEKTALIIHRANQLTVGDEPLVEYDPLNFDAISIARQEVNARILKNLIVRRTLPDGSYEDINSTELIILS